MTTIEHLEGGIILSRFDGSDWHRDRVGTRAELVDWLCRNKVSCIDPDELFPDVRKVGAC